MKLLHDGAGVARILEAAAVKGEKGEERNYIYSRIFSRLYSEA